MSSIHVHVYKILIVILCDLFKINKFSGYSVFHCGQSEMGFQNTFIDSYFYNIFIIIWFFEIDFFLF